MDRNHLNCASIEELLPWYLNGTLESAESSAVARHLEECPQCRQEHRDAAMAAASYAAHPTAEDLVDFAFHRLSFGDRRSRIQAHLEFCSSCTEEVALISESRDALESLEEGELPAASTSAPPTSPVIAFPGPKKPTESFLGSSPTVLRWAAAAAIAFLATTVVWQISRPPVPGSSTASVQAGGGSAGPLQTLPRTNLDRIRERLAGAPSWALSDSPTGGWLPSGPRGNAVLLLPTDATEVVLWASDLGTTEGKTFSAQILGPEEELLWAARNLVADDQDKIQLQIPVEALQAARIYLEVARYSSGESKSLGIREVEVRR
ncbi:MAG: zf-HC2 domain-containing protein [Deltaproteobacteria bacterium]|nr:zf-HC2 domain-containing protein [Deltaproteobacteria bacterium]